MTPARKTEEKLAVLATKTAGESHITVKQAACAVCEHRPCVPACPADLWTWIAEEGRMALEHAGCLECGTCLLVCPVGAVSWQYPAGGFGVQYRYG